MRWDFWQAVADNPYISGQFLWTGMDYLGEAPRWPARSSGAGLLDLAGLPKPEYFYRQSLWAAEPTVYLGTRDVPIGDEGASLWTHKKAAPVWAGITVFPFGCSVSQTVNRPNCSLMATRLAAAAWPKPRSISCGGMPPTNRGRSPFTA